jgi:hypothetical protein
MTFIMKNEYKSKYSRKTRLTACMLMVVMASQMLNPTTAVALTTGPTQPEVQGFEPVGTTDMVDMFSGSFLYNIPLLDIEGYPINISYHGGVTMEQEASWVGLGWNINPGVINRTVRGVPDDFNGDSLRNDFNIKPERLLRVGTGIGTELVGVGDPFLGLDLSLGANVNISNYRGVSCDFSFGGGINVFHTVTAGIGMGVGSQTGATIDYDARLEMSTPEIVTKIGSGSAGLNGSIGGGYNTRTALKDIQLGMSASGGTGGKLIRASGGLGFQAKIPIGLNNYVPVITNSSEMKTIHGRVKPGSELSAAFGYVNISAMYNKLEFHNDASRRAYGYLYLQNANANDSDVMDFTRDKDGMFNKTMQYLPMPHMAYDVYSLSGQGTGGMFRPFRNDFGNVCDPVTRSTASSTSREIEGGLGDVFATGSDFPHSNTQVFSGPWINYKRATTVQNGYTSSTNGSIYENVYFKQGGELTEVDSAYYQTIKAEQVITPRDAMSLPRIKPNSDTKRDPRSNLVYYHTASQASTDGVASSSNISNYTDPNFTPMSDPATARIARVGAGYFQRRKDQISEFVQVQKDGRKYVYGIPALNNVQREAAFSIEPSSNPLNLGDGVVKFSTDDASNTNSKGKDNYYNSTITPSYAHSYLLSSVLSSDYVDVTGNGISDDDLGEFTKLNYTRTDSDYRWVAPYSPNFDSALYAPGFWSDQRDDKGSFVCGSREQWYLHSIESKNYIAEFYISMRDDARGISKALLNTDESWLFKHDKAGVSASYKLDSIKLYNKHDRLINGSSAVPVKTVFFVYNYSLCPGTPNSVAAGGGKLTLRQIYFRFGNSQRSMVSPYQFDYGFNPGYSLSSKDRWGNYKPNNAAFTNYEYPYVNQNDPLVDLDYASAWSLAEIRLPSGGAIKASYESNDYAFVQDKPVDQMFMVQGLGYSRNFKKDNRLYNNSYTPYLYIYFERRSDKELASLSTAQNYFGRDFRPGAKNCMYFNFNVQLTSSSNTFEQIKGYANVLDVGICYEDTRYGYVRIEPVTPKGGGGSLNPISFTALNTGRYNLPQIIFPGQDPNESSLLNILKGLKHSFNELLNIGKSPVLNLTNEGAARTVKLSKSYIRLQSVGLRKKGGGQRVKELRFSDRWDALAGGDEPGAFYGKQYSYQLDDPNYGLISSGVASYEPLIGGDENPFRTPVPYTVQSGSNWLPNDAIDLYQELPLGETFYPSGQIGYRKVVVTSLHKDEGRSSKSADIYEFYTAKDFPIQVLAGGLAGTFKNHYGFFSQENSMEATQGYTLIFNDMHGKPKKVEHDVYNTALNSYQPFSHQIFNYKQQSGKLNNEVKCLVFNGSHMELQKRQLGIEEDVTLDTREKVELTQVDTKNNNLNVFFVPFVPFPIPIPLKFSWSNDSRTEFHSAVVTKVIQQYGILDNVDLFNEGAHTIMSNEIFDPSTGIAVVTSTTNEFNDKEYATNIPASWAYQGMSSAYENACYQDSGTISIGSSNVGALNVINSAPFVAGDELTVTYNASGSTYQTNVFVLATAPGSGSPAVLPRFPLSTPGWAAGTTLSNVKVRIINSGHKNILNEIVQSYTSVNYPIVGSTLTTALTGLVNVNAKTFADSNTRIAHNYFSSHDAINPYAIAERGQWRLLSEYSYHTKRNYTGVTARNAGLFDAAGLFSSSSGLWPYRYIEPQSSDSNWHKMRTITKWSPNGKEVENVDAIGNYSTALFGYNEELPIAVASNSYQGDILSLNFEEHTLLRANGDLLTFPAFCYSADPMSFPSSKYEKIGPGLVTPTTSHTGRYSYYAEYSYNGNYISLNVNNDSYPGIVDKYNTYFPSSYPLGKRNEYLPFSLTPGKKYTVNYWVRDSAGGNKKLEYKLPQAAIEFLTPTGNLLVVAKNKSKIIDGWQQIEIEATAPLNTTSARLILQPYFYIDDVRIFPSNANMKAFVYSPPVTLLHASGRQHMATLDENNYATMYEYDQEGNLIRTKKETARGIITTSEARKGNVRL